MAMLELNDIKKDYRVANETVHALKGVSLKFRKSEFVSILGPSGCGKTTLLNIIGGLDHYTSGDLVIAGKSTELYGDRDWDTYRNHSIGFIFQSYHLIPHQTILQNVELALMISGVTKQERRQRAIEALEKVGLSDKLHSRPNQLSGGQAQRVAIARALINDPEIVLADEPTGALDSVTSVQIMELLKEISKDRLVIMVTHNPELAEKYSTRIVRLLDGEVTSDTKPYDGTDDVPVATGAQVNEETASESQSAGYSGEVKTNKGSKKKTSMSIGMAMSLSLKNLLSKSKRTAMVAVAGSIGIIGVSLVLAISAGVQGYIKSMEDDMLSGNPVAVTRSTLDFSSLMDMNASSRPKVDITKLPDNLYVRSLMETLGNVTQGVTKTNEITEQYIHYVESIPDEYINVIQYGYGFDVANNVYTKFTVEEGAEDLASRETSITAIRGMYSQILSENKDYSNFAGTVSTVATFAEVPDNYQYVMSQYDIIAVDRDGEIITDESKITDAEKKAIFADPTALILVVDESMVTDLMLGQYGYLTEVEFLNYAYKAVGDASYDESLGLVGSGLKADGTPDAENGLSIKRFIGKDSKKFTYLPNDVIYRKISMTAPDGSTTDMWLHMPYLEGNVVNANGYAVPVANPDLDISKGTELGVKIIIQKKEDISYSCLSPGIYYTNALTQKVREDSKDSEIVKAINESEKGYIDSLAYSFYYTVFNKEGNKVSKVASSAIYDSGGLMEMLMSGLSGGTDKSTMLRVNASMLGGSELPVAISIYPVNFGAKDFVTEYLDVWNEMCTNDSVYTFVNAEGKEIEVTLTEGMKITYSDPVGLIINMVNTMIEMITIALVAFTALSLVVSTVMIGIITYVSVVERIKEIGILRAVGARKKDIKRLFNAETFIIGLTAGLFGILITYLISLIINVIVLSLAGIWGIAALPWWQAVIMVCVSVVLTLISGLIPASAAAKKDPVVALRTE